MPPNNLANTDKDLLLTFLLCMLHGIDTVHNDPDPAKWTYKQNGRTLDYVTQIRAMLLVYHKADDALMQSKADRMLEMLTAHYNDGRGNLLDLRYNIHILQKPPFEVPNPLILSTVLRCVSNNTVLTGVEGGATCDKTNAHNFKVRYLAYIDEDRGTFQQQVNNMKQTVEEFFQMYEQNAYNLFVANQLLPASTYIQNNQTELPAVAYHGTLTIDKIKGGREEVRCVGHLGNSFPGCATIREGKGMLNTFNSMPTPVHVM